jgi:hypothetical protein
VSQERNSRAAVERLMVERAATADPAHAAALESQIDLHAALAGLSDDDLAAIELSGPVPKLASQLEPERLTPVKRDPTGDVIDDMDEG